MKTLLKKEIDFQKLLLKENVITENKYKQIVKKISNYFKRY